MNLYHFTSTEIAITKILPGMKFRMNFLSKMNDPNENLHHILNHDEGLVNKYVGQSWDLDLMAQRMTDETRVLAFSIDREIICDGIKTKLEAYEFQRMWTYYGQKHSGICLVIDKEKFKTENKRIIESYGIIDSKVVYSNFASKRIPTPLYGTSPGKILKGVSNSVSDFWLKCQNNKSFVNDRFFTKSFDWEGESEYRFLCFTSENQEIFLSFKESLIMIILGISFSRHYLPAIKHLVSDDKIKVINIDLEGNFEIQHTIL